MLLRDRWTRRGLRLRLLRTPGRWTGRSAGLYPTDLLEPSRYLSGGELGASPV